MLPHQLLETSGPYTIPNFRDKGIEPSEFKV